MAPEVSNIEITNESNTYKGACFKIELPVES